MSAEKPKRSYLSRIEITDFRNIRKTIVEPSPDMNYLVGGNAAGKSSFLEAIYFGLNLKSFRTRYAKQQVYSGADSATVRFDLFDHEHDKSSLGASISLYGKQLITCKINSKPLEKVSDLVNVFPSIYVDPECISLIDGPPSERRKFLDWGVFHVKRSYPGVFQSWQRSLRQRNSILKLIAKGVGEVPQHKLRQELSLWTQHYIKYAEIVHDLRLSYFEDFCDYWSKEQEALSSSGLNVGLLYHRGWPPKTKLASQLFPECFSELYSGHTAFGPHKADVKICMSIKSDAERSFDLLAKDYCSRGQKKLIGSTMRLVQGNHFNVVTRRPLVLLIDDLGSELDVQNRRFLLEMINRIVGQKFYAIVGSGDDLGSYYKSGKMFHVKHGSIIEISRVDDGQAAVASSVY